MSARTNLRASIRARLLNGEDIQPGELSRLGVRAADVISQIRRRDLLPVARVPAIETTRNQRGELVQRRSRRAASYRILSSELAKYAADRLQQIQDMQQQHQNRQRRDLARAAIAALTNAGQAATIPPTLTEWAALNVPAPQSGISAPINNIKKQDVNA